jgi:site-specific DNA-cytosine methylase
MKYYPTDPDRFYSAIGNAVNVKVISKIAKNLFN